MIRTMVDIHIRSELLKPLRPLLKCWGNLNVGYARAWKWKDCAWWYNERTSVGLLAAAAWMNGGHSLEEYATPKSKGRSQYPGRGDLYFESRKVRYIAEAKHEWVTLSSASRIDTSGFMKRLQDVRASVVDAETKRCTKLGLLFIAPKVPKRQRGDIPKLVNRLTEMLNNYVPYDAAAWVFPKKTNSLCHGDHLYPGIALLILNKQRRK